MNANAEKAETMFKEGFNCAQSVLTCAGEGAGFPREAGLRLAAPFGGGMGCLGETCGAVTGAFMVIGLGLAQTDPRDAEAKQKVYGMVREFSNRFKARHGSIVCRDLIGFDLRTPEGMQKARESGVFRSLCPPLVRSAVEIVEELLSRSQRNEGI